jgi:transcriptional regulator with XRE-family HTH domain
MATALMLRTSSEILRRAQDALSLRGYTSLQLANELSLTVQLVDNFLNGEIVDRNTYDLVCEKLNIAVDPDQDIAVEQVIKNRDDLNIKVSNSNTNSNIIVDNTALTENINKSLSNNQNSNLQIEFGESLH